MADKYILIGRLPVPCDDLLTWALWIETADRRVAETHIGCLRVSTVFMGLDHNHWGKGPPMLFETMIFGDVAESYQTRCETWDEAERMHAAAEVVAAGWIARANALLAGSAAPGVPLSAASRDQSSD